MNATGATSQPLVTKRPAEARGKTELGWLHSRHTFSFGDYHDPAHMGFRSLRVINDDIVEPGGGFGTHPHRDAEIFSYVIEGELEHKDSLGNGSVIRQGGLQHISAGSGIRHSEFNPSKTDRVHFLQIWLMPNTLGGEPRYAQSELGESARPNSLTLLFAGGAREGAVQIRQEAEIFFGRLDEKGGLAADLGQRRHAWLHLIKGQIQVLGLSLGPGDAAAISNASLFEISSSQHSEFLLFALD